MHIPPPGPQRMRCNSLIFGWALILVGLLLFPIGGFLLMAGGVALLAYAHKLKRLHGGTGVTPASTAAGSVVNAAALQQLTPTRASSALDKPFGDTFPISVWIDDAPFVESSAQTAPSLPRGTVAAGQSSRGAPSFPSPQTDTILTP